MHAPISAAIMTEKEGDVWVQPIYYPFAQMANYGKGVVLREIAEGPSYELNNKTVPYVDEAVVYHEAAQELVLFAVNRCEEEAAEVSLQIQDFGGLQLIQHTALYSDDKKATNAEDHHRVHPRPVEGSRIEGDTLYASLPPLSWNMLRIRCDGSEDEKDREKG